MAGEVLVEGTGTNIIGRIGDSGSMCDLKQGHPAGEAEKIDAKGHPAERDHVQYRLNTSSGTALAKRCTAAALVVPTRMRLLVV